MRTHEFAESLLALARLLKSGPDTELAALSLPPPVEANGTDPSAFARSVTTMAALSRMPKAEWRRFIQDWKLPVEVKNSDSVRDLVGRLFNFLDEHPDALRRIHKDATKKNKKASAELMEAFSVLLGDEEREGRQ
jgi:hypothetical protein